jgi:UPF0755 protein
VRRAGQALAAAAVVAFVTAAAITGLLVLPGPAKVGPVVLSVAEGEGFAQVATDLASLEVVRSALVLRLWARLTGRDREVEWGDYVFQAPVTPLAVVDRLTRPPDPIGRVTIPEGLTVDETLALLVAHGHGPREAYDTLLRDPRFLVREGLPLPGGEGYLFPDTYLLPSTMSPERVLHEMILRFHRVLTPELIARGRAHGLTPLEVVTLASLIEEETTLADEQRLVSAVFHNRLRLGMRLQSDPTVLYGRGSDDREISRMDLARPTRHNTYVIAGLPPSPIANPGKGALEAAVDPAASDALYFVARGDGSHEFTPNLAAHNAAVHRFLRDR